MDRQADRQANILKARQDKTKTLTLRCSKFLVASANCNCNSAILARDTSSVCLNLSLVWKKSKCRKKDQIKLRNFFLFPITVFSELLTFAHLMGCFHPAFLLDAFIPNVDKWGQCECVSEQLSPDGARRLRVELFTTGRMVPFLSNFDNFSNKHS